jgi:hypothetical protein
MPSLVFHPAGEQQADAFRRLFKGYSEYQQKQYPIPENANKDYGEWVHQKPTVLSPLSYKQPEEEYAKNRNIVFTRIRVCLDGYEEDPRFPRNWNTIREKFYIWHNAEVWRAFQDQLQLQIILADEFNKELK